MKEQELPELTQLDCRREFSRHPTDGRRIVPLKFGRPVIPGHAAMPLLECNKQREWLEPLDFVAAEPRELLFQSRWGVRLKPLVGELARVLFKRPGAIIISDARRKISRRQFARAK